jgi:site-specific DNA-methyltransferase (adenine-specific)
MSTKIRAGRNRTINLSPAELLTYKDRLLRLREPVDVAEIIDRVICQDIFDVLPYLQKGFIDLLFIDPPYNLTKQFNENRFTRLTHQGYADWIDRFLSPMVPLLKSTASVYICADWRSSSAVHEVARKYFTVRNRITWEREKGRGAGRNWKNCSEDIWFCTVSDAYTFNLAAVKVKRRVLAPYTLENGEPKDWERSPAGNFRFTHPSNLWTDLTVPFWSMPENTDHPTQKSEKMLAKIILASSRPGDIVFDPFLGSGTTSVAAKKLGRRFVGVEMDEFYCCLTEKRLQLAEKDKSIQGYSEGIFKERNEFQKRIRKI